MIFDEVTLIYHILSHGLEVGEDLGRARLLGALCSSSHFVNSITLTEKLARGNKHLSHNPIRLGVFLKTISPKPMSLQVRGYNGYRFGCICCQELAV